MHKIVKREKKATRCNNQMFIINFCLNMFRASLCPSSGEQRPCNCILVCYSGLLDVVGSGCGALRCRMRAVLASYNPKVHYRTRKLPPPVSILIQPNPVHIPTSHLLEIRPNNIHPSTPRSPQFPISLMLTIIKSIFYKIFGE
jgi:hypothetical protein